MRYTISRTMFYGYFSLWLSSYHLNEKREVEKENGKAVEMEAK